MQNPELAPPLSDRRPEYAPAGALFTALALEAFRLNGALLAAGTALCQGTGLTAARWQILGAVALGARPITVAQIARVMGQTRQSVQRLVDELEGEGLLERLPHPEHRRARLVQLTAPGEARYAEVLRRQVPWANRTAGELPLAALEAALDTLRAVRARLEAEAARR